MTLSRKDIDRMNRREEMLNTLINRFGFESKPTLYFVENAWKDIYNMEIYYDTAVWIGQRATA